ncbi:fucose mutarotase isoform X2 [Canis aureus]
MVVLKGVPALLSPELLYALARMGHGDEIVLADVNFPTSSICKCGPEELRADGLGIPPLLEAVLQLLPLDTYVESPVSARHPTAPPRSGPRSLLPQAPEGCRHGAGAQRQEEGPSDSRVGDLPVHPVGGRLRGRRLSTETSSSGRGCWPWMRPRPPGPETRLDA